MEAKVRVGVIGCGSICGHYFKGCGAFHILDVVACADLIPERAEAKAEEFGIAKSCPVDDLLADPERRSRLGRAGAGAAGRALWALRVGAHLDAWRAIIGRGR